MAKFVFLVNAHARDLAGSYLVTAREYYVQTLEVFAGIRAPQEDGPFWMTYPAGDITTLTAAETWGVGLEALISASHGTKTLETIETEFLAAVDALHKKYEGQGVATAISSVELRISILLHDLKHTM